nr:unnamed protein product [Callosobruchus analis]
MNTTEEPNLPHDQQLLYKLLVEANKNQTLEIKAELQSLVNKVENTSQDIENLQQRYRLLERRCRKNNVVVFGLTNIENNEAFLLRVLNKLNSVLETNVESNAAGPDGLTKQMLELAIYHIKDHITFVLNKILTQVNFRLAGRLLWCGLYQKQIRLLALTILDLLIYYLPYQNC